MKNRRSRRISREKRGRKGAEPEQLDEIAVLCKAAMDKYGMDTVKDMLGSTKMPRGVVLTPRGIMMPVDLSASEAQRIIEAMQPLAKSRAV